MNRLPGTVDDLRGLRAARWIRESTTGQFDRYGPEAQAELQNGAIERLGLADTGAEWRIAHSGRTVYRSSAMAAMLDAAATGAFDVLLVGYVSRWRDGEVRHAARGSADRKRDPGDITSDSAGNPIRAR